MVRLDPSKMVENVFGVELMIVLTLVSAVLAVFRAEVICLAILVQYRASNNHDIVR